MLKYLGAKWHDGIAFKWFRREYRIRRMISKGGKI